MNIDYEKIGQRIRGWRIRKKMTQEQMATLIEREPAYISRIEMVGRNQALIHC